MGIEIKPYGRLGKSMGVAQLEDSYRKVDSDGGINMGATIDTLKEMQNLLNKVYERLGN